MEQKMLHVYPQKCTACKNCELACAYSHMVDGKLAPPRIRAFLDPQDRPGHNSVVVCMHCDDAACINACPAKALWRDPKTNAVYVVEERCIRCYSCVAACPFGNMQANPDGGIPLKCDLCGGDPACAKFCPTGALVWE